MWHNPCSNKKLGQSVTKKLDHIKYIKEEVVGNFKLLYEIVDRFDESVPYRCFKSRRLICRR